MFDPSSKNLVARSVRTSGRKFTKNPAVSRRFPAIPAADRSGKGLGLVEDDKLVLLGPVRTKMAAGRGGGEEKTDQLF